MKYKIFITIIALSICGFWAYAQNNMHEQKSNSLITENIQKPDSVYYGCVPCCQECSVYIADKPGECPHCGMTLEKRTYLTDAGQKKDNSPVKSNAFKPPKEKK